MTLSEPYYSDTHGGPFTACTRCNQSLQALPTGYQLVKCWHRHEVVYEYALCHGCQAHLYHDFSEDSRIRLREFHEDRMRSGFGSRRCATCSVHSSELKSGNYSITWMFLGKRMEEQVMVCGECTREMQSLFSTHTRTVWDRFLAENFPAPPSDVVVPEPVTV